MIDVNDPASRDRLASALPVPRWVDAVAADGPYPSLEELVEAGRRAALRLSDEELDHAVAAHLRAAERAVGDLAAGDEGLQRTDEGDEAAIARGSEVYEQRFGRVFLLPATAGGPQEVLDELQRRLKNDPAQEAEEAKEQLGRVAELRLRSLFGGGQ